MRMLARTVYEARMPDTAARIVTRGEQMLALRRRRMAASHAFFRGGFRPFCFGGAAWAVIALVLWISAVTGEVTLPAAVDALEWHRHEMLFGFVGAAIAGCILTAVPNWTGRLPIAGSPLAILFGVWVAARLAFLFSGAVGLWFAAILDVGFFVVLALCTSREVLAANTRNRLVVGMVLLFGTANLVDYLAVSGTIPAPDLGWKLAVGIAVLLISLIGWRRASVARFPLPPRRSLPRRSPWSRPLRPRSSDRPDRRRRSSP